MRVGQIVTLKKNTSRRLRVLAISDWDIVTVMDLADKTEKEFEIGQLQRVRRIKQHEEYKEVGKRCKGALYFRRHRVIKKPGRGYRCKYCDRILSDLRYEAERKKR